MYPILQTLQITTGNPATVRDAIAQNTLGFGILWKDSSGRWGFYRYVQYNPTAAVTLAAGTNIPGLCYWKDAARTIVTPTMSECISTKPNMRAGWLLNASLLDGEYGFIQVRGFLGSAVVAASTAVDDSLIGLGITPLICGRTAAGTAATSRPAAIALTAVSGVVSDIDVCCEP